jgi:3-methyladenine DNA glycosylase AlkD
MGDQKFLLQILEEFKQYVEKEKAEKYPQFFQVFPGGYGEGDKFLGIRVPNIRKVAKPYYNLSLEDLTPLISNEYHEIRMFALIILIKQFQLKKYIKKRDAIIDYYLANLEFVNNWDLVDISAPKLLGQYLLDKKRDIIYKLAKSGTLWKERVAILSTFTFIRNRDFDDLIKLAEFFLDHKHDLIHKAIGWMLREVGNRHRPTEVKFLDKHYKKMPRTMLRYAIEKFSEEERQMYLKGKR